MPSCVITLSMSAASRTLHAIGPSVDSAVHDAALPAGTSENVGLNPTTPLQHAGIRIDPPPSVASDSGPIPSATATADPPLLPTGESRVSHGLRVTPISGQSVTILLPNSEVVVLPNGMAPARRSLAMAGASSPSRCGDEVHEPCRVGKPATATRSLTETGTPSSGPHSSPCIHLRSASLAADIALCSSTAQNALTTESSLVTWSSTAPMTSTGESVRCLKPATI